MKYWRLNANTSVVAAILFSGHPYYPVPCLPNTLSVAGHVGGANGVSIGVVGIVLLRIVPTTLVVVNTVLAELAATGTMIDEPAVIEVALVVGGGAGVEEGRASVVDGGGTGGCKEIKAYHFTAALLY